MDYMHHKILEYLKSNARIKASAISVMIVEVNKFYTNRKSWFK
ncbi:hypothetical protein CSC2_27510 [Clostridium zeae]|uniref:Uncharacterized protein n=1 Tax=Clostridium zeae TaxID=2759022 RepID=A0ABQ1EBP4_9CLOT|nr:hypothetical protein [Clostridium zeae]GFZ32225.1 hypothetical protein CSC2_27510 [Clostridium zeae]